jgi:hypothetical protein
MPGLVAPLVAFALGVAFALRARAGAERYDDLERRAAVRIVLLFGVLVLAPVTAYFVAFAGDWSLGYLAEAQRVPSALGLVWVVATAGAAPLGFEAGLRAVRRRAGSELIALAAVPAAAAFVFVVALYPELRLDGTTQQIRGGFGTQPVAGSSLGWAILWMDAMIAVGAALTLRALVPRRAHRATARTATATPQERADDDSEGPRTAPPPAAAEAPAPAPEPRRLLGQRGRRRAD